ncbi:MAG: hypothetical protein ACI4W2_06675 [Eubacterium sp.]
MIGTFGDKAVRFAAVVEASSGGVAFFLMPGLGIGLILQAGHQEIRQEV